MGRILVNGSWYEPLSSRSILEAEYEQSILRHSSDLFPNYLCLKFNAAVQSDFGTSRPDMVLIDREFRGWTIVEAELEHHSLSQHVEPQMRRLVNGIYDDSHAAAILREADELDKTRLFGLVRNVEPEFLVIVPREDSEWRATLSNLGVKLAVLEVFVDALGRRVVMSSGDSPRGWEEDELTGLRRDGFLQRAFRLDIPTAIPLTDQISLLYRGSVTTWRVIRAKGATYILPNGSQDLEERGDYRICRTPQGGLAIEVKKS